MANKKGQSIIPQYNPNKIVTPTIYLNKDFAKLNSWQKDGDDANVFVSIRYIKKEFQCFSDWNKDEMNAFWNFIERIHEYTWEMVKKQGGKSGKAGIGSTLIPIEKYPVKLQGEIEPGTSLIEMRLTDKMRIHCFRDKAICYIYILDRNHELF